MDPHYNQQHPPPSYPSPAMAYPPPPVGYPFKDAAVSVSVSGDPQQQNTLPQKTTPRGDGGFWEGCCAALCCCCVLDCCF